MSDDNQRTASDSLQIHVIMEEEDEFSPEVTEVYGERGSKVIVSSSLTEAPAQSANSGIGNSQDYGTGNLEFRQSAQHYITPSSRPSYRSKPSQNILGQRTAPHAPQLNIRYTNETLANAIQNLR